MICSVPMNIAQSQMTLESLREATAKRAVPGAEGVEVEVFHLKPDEDVEIWDRILEELPNPGGYVYSEFVGQAPRHFRDGRRYRKLFHNQPGEEPATVTFASSIYRLSPDTVVMQGRRIGQTQGPASALFTLFVCDRDNPMKLPSYRREILDPREEAAAVDVGREHDSP